MTRLIVAELRVTDLERSLDFYKRLLGVPFADVERHTDEAKVPHAHASWGSWREGEPFLRLNLYPAGERERTRSAIGFVVTDLEAAHRQLVDAGVVVVDRPSDTAWGRMARYLDPDGNEVSLTELGTS